MYFSERRLMGKNVNGLASLAHGGLQIHQYHGRAKRAKGGGYFVTSMYITQQMSSLGGGIQGISPRQTLTNSRSSSDVIARKIIVKAWNNPYATGVVNGRSRVSSPFPTVYNITDYLARKNYVCNIPNPIQETRHRMKHNMGSIIQNCDGTGIPCSNGNTKFVADSSLYTTFKNQRAVNWGYNDRSR